MKMQKATKYIDNCSATVFQYSELQDRRVYPIAGYVRILKPLGGLCSPVCVLVFPKIYLGYNPFVLDKKRQQNAC